MNLQEDNIKAFLMPLLEAEGCFLVDLKQLPGNRVRVFIDKDSGITISTCAGFNRRLRSYFEEEGILGDNYSLEVSSPGLNQPFKVHRQYVKNIGKQLEVVLGNGSRKEGKLVNVNSDNIILEAETTKGDKNGTPVSTFQIQFAEINKTTVVITI